MSAQQVAEFAMHAKRLPTDNAPDLMSTAVRVKVALARISHTLAGAGVALAAVTRALGGFRALPIHPVLPAARKPAGTIMPYVIIPQPYEKCGLAQTEPNRQPDQAPQD